MLSKDEQSVVAQISERQKSKDSISIWFLYSVYGSLLPIILTVILSFLTLSNPVFYKIVNNGSVSLIAYSIIISAVFYLLDSTQPSFETIRKKILGYAILTLFINISIYTILNIFGDRLSGIAQFILLILSICFLWGSIHISKFMVILQESVINDYKKSMEDERKNVKLPPTEDQNGIEY